MKLTNYSVMTTAITLLVAFVFSSTSLGKPINQYPMKQSLDHRINARALARQPGAMGNPGLPARPIPPLRSRWKICH